MWIQANGGSVDVKVGPSCVCDDVDALTEAVASARPLSRMSIDFSALRGCDYPALVLLASLLDGLENCEIALSGITAHQARTLRHLGFDPGIHPHQAP